MSKSKKEITKEIERICSDGNNFTGDNYGTESADNGYYEIFYDEFAARRTLVNFAEWLLNKK